MTLIEDMSNTDHWAGGLILSPLKLGTQINLFLSSFAKVESLQGPIESQSTLVQ
jgi:hypothetical protein